MTTTHHEHRFNPWPYSIIGFFIMAIVGAVVWIGFCIGHGTDLVARDYYEQEIEYQGQMERMERTGALSGRARIAFDPELLVVTVQLPSEHASSGVRGFIHLYRPSRASLDQTLSLAMNPAGEQQLDVAALAPGLWDVRVRWSVEGDEYYLNRKITIGRSRF